MKCTYPCLVMMFPQVKIITHKHNIHLKTKKYSDEQEQTICTPKNRHRVKHEWTNTKNTCTN